MDFLNHWEGGVFFYLGFFLSLQCTVTHCRLREFEEQGKTEEVTLNNKEENS